LQPLWSGIRAMAGDSSLDVRSGGCAAWRVGAAPYVEIAVLTALRHEAPPPDPAAPLTQYQAF